MNLQYHLFRIHWEGGMTQNLVGNGDTQILALVNALVYADYDHGCIKDIRWWEEITNGALQKEEDRFDGYQQGRLASRAF
jgi:hypothetical protein